MRIRDTWNRALWSDDVEGSGGGDPPAPAPAPRRQAAPAQEPHYQPQQAPAPSRNSDTVADLRAEAAARRIRNRELEEQLVAERQRADDAQAQLESARASAVAPLTAKLEKAHARLIDATLMAKMTAAGLQDADLVVLASKMPGAPKVTLNDEFEVVGADEMVEAFKKWKPEFFKRAADPAPKAEEKPAPRQPRAAPAASADPAPATTQPVTDVRKMTKQEYAEYKSRTMQDFRRQSAAPAWGAR